jgi:hypothetical protein
VSGHAGALRKGAATSRDTADPPLRYSPGNLSVEPSSASLPGSARLRAHSVVNVSEAIDTNALSFGRLLAHSQSKAEN